MAVTVCVNSLLTLVAAVLVTEAVADNSTSSNIDDDISSMLPMTAVTANDDDNELAAVLFLDTAVVCVNALLSVASASCNIVSLFE